MLGDWWLLGVIWIYALCAGLSNVMQIKRTKENWCLETLELKQNNYKNWKEVYFRVT